MREITAAEKFAKARLQLAMDKPFWGYLLYRFDDKRVRADPRIPTMATDGRSLHYNAAWVDSLDFEMLKSHLAHAISSVALLHPFRRSQRDVKLYNEASDHVVNLTLIEDGSFKLPSDAPCDSRFAGMSVEQVYSVLQSEQPQGQPQQQQQGGGDGEGSATGSSGAEGEQESDEPNAESEQQQEPSKQQQGAEDDVEDAGDEEQETDVEKGDGEQDDHDQDDAEGDGKGQQSEKPRDVPGTSQADVLDFGSLSDEGDDSQPSEAEQRSAEEDWASAAAAAVMQAEVAGHLSANQARQIRSAFEERMSFEEYMVLFAKSLSRSETSWSVRDRRFAATDAVILPGKRSTKVGKLVYGVDTSGSIDEPVLARFQAAGVRVQEDLRPDETIVLYSDAEICGEERFADGEELRFERVAGGGGTDFRPFFARVREMIEQGEDICGMIYVTDLEGTFPHEEDVADLPPILWVSTEKTEAPIGITAYFHNK